MDMMIDFPGGLKVEAHYQGYSVLSDQTEKNGGEDSAPSPFVLFLSSIGTCAGFYVLRFCKQHDLPLEGVRVVQHITTNSSTRMVEEIELEIQVPPEFPEKYHAALVKSANLCKVKKHFTEPPSFKTYTRVVEG